MQEGELLRAMADLLDQKLEPVYARLSTLDEKVDILHEKTDALTERVDALEEKVDVLDEKVNVLDGKVSRNYDVTLEFYGSQKEFNRFLLDELKIISGTLTMHTNQIARNTQYLMQDRTA